MPNCDVLTPVEGKLPSVVVDETIVATLASRLPAQSKEMVQEHLGISPNTWLKIKKGQPIRRSTAEMLVQRFHNVTCRVPEGPGLTRIMD